MRFSRQENPQMKVNLELVSELSGSALLSLVCSFPGLTLRALWKPLRDPSSCGTSKAEPEVDEKIGHDQIRG